MVEYRNYTVTWVIDVGARSPLAAARAALEIQRDPESIATCFRVRDDQTGKETDIDLDGLQVEEKE